MERLRSVVRFGVLGMFVVAWSASPSLSAQQGKVEQEVMQLEREWCAADVKQDAAVFARILSDDYTGVSSLTGKLSGKADYLATLKSNKTTVCEVDMMKVRVYGDTAVATGRSTVKSSTFNGQSMGPTPGCGAAEAGNAWRAKAR